MFFKNIWISNIWTLYKFLYNLRIADCILKESSSLTFLLIVNNSFKHKFIFNSNVSNNPFKFIVSFCNNVFFIFKNSIYLFIEFSKEASPNILISNNALYISKAIESFLIRLSKLTESLS